MPGRRSDDYSNREIDTHFREIKELLQEIKNQTTLTNGRVTKLELWREGLMGKMLGASTVIGFVWTVVWVVITKKFL